MATRKKKSFVDVKSRKSYNSVDFVDHLLFVEITENMFGGYKQDLLVSSLNGMEKEFFVCHECKGLMRNACQIGEEQTPVCEMCVTEGVSSQPMMRSRKMIPQLQMKCPLTTRGCEWNGMICEVEEHLNVCPEFVLQCQNSCDVILPRKELDEHLKHLCMKRIVDCEHCHLSLMYKDLSQHHDMCVKFQLPCPNKCDMIVKRKQLNTHIDADCPNTVVDCPYRKFGCEREMKRCELEDHEKVNKIVHLLSTTLFTVSKMEEMGKKMILSDKKMEKMENKMTLSDRKMQQMEEKVIRMTKILEHVAYPILLRAFISEISLRENLSTLLYVRGPGFTISWRFYTLRLSFTIRTSNLLVTTTIDYDTKRSQLVEWPFEGRFKLTFIDRIDIHKSLIYESAVVKLRPKHGSFAGIKDTYPDNLKLAYIQRDLLLHDRFISENGVEFTLQIQEAEDISILETMEK